MSKIESSFNALKEDTEIIDLIKKYSSKSWIIVYKGLDLKENTFLNFVGKILEELTENSVGTLVIFLNRFGYTADSFWDSENEFAVDFWKVADKIGFKK